MYGFSDKALILLPKADMFLDTRTSYQTEFIDAYKKVIQFLRSRGIKCFTFDTDELVNRDHRFSGLERQQTLTRADAFFAINNCQYMENLSHTIPTEQSVLKEAADKNKMPEKPSIAERFQVTEKRRTAVLRNIIRNAKLIVQFDILSKRQYNPMLERESNRAVISVDMKELWIDSIYYAGKKVPVSEFLGVDFGVKHIKEWEV